MNILPIATSALTAASTATAVRANNVANVVTEDFTAAEPLTGLIPNGGGVAVFVQDTGQPVNLVREIIGLRSALHQYQAAAELVEAGAEMNKTLIQAFA